MKTVIVSLTAIFTLIVWSFAEVQETYRVLTSTDGKEIKAWIRKVENDEVTFRRDDGKIFTVPFSRLSEEDQVELRKMQAEKPAETPAPTADDAKVSKHLYPRTLTEMKTACTGIREAAKKLKGFTEEEQNAVAELNIYRYLSGLHSEVGLDRRYCEIADRASEGCAKEGKLSHDACPEGKSCNLHQGQSSFAASVHGYMEDPGENNRGRRGHRLWCLDPDLAKTGFGRDKKKHFYAMWVDNGGQGGGPRRGRPVKFYSYPGNGFYPVSRMRGNGWSLCAGTVLPPGDPDIHVFELTARPEKSLSAATMPKDAKEVKIRFQKQDAASAWMPGWVVFEPDVKPKAGKIYWVSFKMGGVRLGYVVEFIDGKF